jgi:hypothetical protein
MVLESAERGADSLEDEMSEAMVRAEVDVLNALQVFQQEIQRAHTEPETRDLFLVLQALEKKVTALSTWAQRKLITVECQER